MINLEELKSKNIHIVGLSGTEGAQLALFLRAKGCVNLTAHDFCDKEKFRENFLMFHGALEIEDRKNYFEKINALPIKKCFKENYLESIEKADLVFVSQGWYLYEFNKPKLFELKDKGIPFYTILNLYLSICKAKTIGITGSNGKTTTSRLIWEILKENTTPLAPLSKQQNQSPPDPALREDLGGFFVLYVGNDRNAVQDLFRVEALEEKDFLVLEISNRQLKLIKDQSPNIGIITNITPNHINEHDSFEEYAYQKSKVWSFQKEGDFAIVNFDDNVSRQCLDTKTPLIPLVRGTKILNKSMIIRFSIKEKADVYIKNNQIFVHDEYILDLSDIKIPGKHNVENVLAAIAATYFAGIKPTVIREAVSQFTGVEKRLEFVGEVDWIKFYNDLSSTTPVSTIAAIKAFEDAKSITLILGGDDKNLKYEDLIKVINEKVDTLILMDGTVKGKILKAPLIPFVMGRWDTNLLNPPCQGDNYKDFIKPYIKYNFKLTELAKENRNNPTKAESKYWYDLLSRSCFADYRFIRQKPINNFILDFYCSKLLLGIEIDGGAHAEQEEYDKERTLLLNEYGIEIIRYRNEDVMNDLENVCKDLLKKILIRKASMERKASLTREVPEGRRVSVFEAKTILEAFQVAKENTKFGGVVLLSPAGEGFFTKFLNRRTGGMSLDRILCLLKNNSISHPQ